MQDKTVTTKIILGLPVSVPRVPNFLRVDDSESAFSIGQFSDDELRSIGEAWTEQLIKRAGEIRNAKAN